MAEGDRHDARQRRAIWPPQPGFFRLRLAKNAWPVPARITHDGDMWQATIDGSECAAHADPALAPRVTDIWEGGWIVDEAEYRWALAVRDAAAAADHTDHPALNPTKAINPLRLIPL